MYFEAMLIQGIAVFTPQSTICSRTIAKKRKTSDLKTWSHNVFLTEVYWEKQQSQHSNRCYVQHGGRRRGAGNRQRRRGNPHSHPLARRPQSPVGSLRRQQRYTTTPDTHRPARRTTLTSAVAAYLPRACAAERWRKSAARRRRKGVSGAVCAGAEGCGGPWQCVVSRLAAL